MRVRRRDRIGGSPPESGVVAVDEVPGERPVAGLVGGMLRECDGRGEEHDEQRERPCSRRLRQRGGEPFQLRCPRYVTVRASQPPPVAWSVSRTRFPGSKPPPI